MARRQQSRQPQSSLPISKIAFDIPLASLNEREKPGTPGPAGIQVSQVAMVTVEESKLSISKAGMRDYKDYD